MASAVELVTTQIHTFGSAVEIDPGHALLQEVHRSAGHVAWLNVQLEQSSPSCLADNALVGLYRKERIASPLSFQTEAKSATSWALKPGVSA